jgi:hypothetical protein
VTQQNLSIISPTSHFSLQQGESFEFLPMKNIFSNQPLISHCDTLISDGIVFNLFRQLFLVMLEGSVSLK